MQRVRLAFADHQVVWCINEMKGAHNLLCSFYGTRKVLTVIRGKYPHMAYQTTPGKAVYSVTREGIEQHSSCTVIMAG